MPLNTLSVSMCVCVFQCKSFVNGFKDKKEQFPHTSIVIFSSYNDGYNKKKKLLKQNCSS